MKIQLKVPFETMPERPIELGAYLVDQRGDVVALAPLRDEICELNVDASRAHGLSIRIAPIRPDIQEGLPTSGQLQQLRAYEPTFSFDPKQKLYEVKPIPAYLLKNWWLCSCRVRGRVVRQSTAGAPMDMPVCGARVHICEVDPVWILLDRLPDLELLRLRDDIVQLIHRPIPWPPEPDPGPLSRLGSVDIGGAPEPATAAPSALAGVELLADNPTITDSAPPLSAQFADSVPPAVYTALRSSTVTSLRVALLENATWIHPYLCLWPWIWPWLTRCDEIAVVDADSSGRFDTTLFHSCSDTPDLYFWVEYYIDGAWTPVYQPPRPCATYWNFDCASEVTLRISDPRVPACGGLNSPKGKTVVVKSIGNRVSVCELLGAAAGTQEGLVTGESAAEVPLLGTLELRADFGEDLAGNAGNYRYRWTYKRLKDAGGNAVVDVEHVMTRDVVRHYRTWSGGAPIDLTHKLGPLAGNFFEVWNPVTSTTPVGDHLWMFDDAHEDLVSGFLPSAGLDPSRTRDTSVSDHHLDDRQAGLYELVLQLFHPDDSVVDWHADGIDLYEANVVAPFGPAPMTTQESPPEHRVFDSSGHTIGFRLHVFIDNSFCEAEILPVTAGSAVGPCGFIDYLPKASAHLAFKAKHPHDFAGFRFQVVRGTTPIGPASVPAWHSVGASPANGFAKGSGWIWSKDLDVAGSSGLVEGCPDGRAAFSETLYVRATGTDGWQRASWLDENALPEAFALNPVGPPFGP